MVTTSKHLKQDINQVLSTLGPILGPIERVIPMKLKGQEALNHVDIYTKEHH